MTISKENLLENLVEQSLLSRGQILRVLEVLHLTRFMDDKMAKLVRQNKGATFQLSVCGHELIGAVSALSLSPGVDWGFPYYRDRAFAIGLGCSLVDIFASFLARDIENHSGGRMMPEHCLDVKIVFNSILDGRIYREFHRSVSCRREFFRHGPINFHCAACVFCHLNIPTLV